MPIMTRMRDNMPTILIGLVVVFLITIVFEWGMNYSGRGGGSHDAVGVIEGKKITYVEFSELVKRMAENQKKESGADPSDESMRQIREQVWNSLVSQILFEKVSQKAGIAVSNQEIVDWVRGENPPEFLIQQFRDSTGQFNRAAYESAVNDPRNKDIWIQVETALRQQRLNEKLQSMVLASVQISPGEVQERFADMSVKVKAEYAFFDPNKFVDEKTITVSDNDLRKYYDDNQEEFKAKATRKLKYVLFYDQATAKDTQDVRTDMMQALSQAKAGLDFTDVQKKFSESSVDPVTVKHGSMNPEREKALFAATIGDFVGPILDKDGYHLSKILEEKKSDQTSIRARHILLNIPAGGREEEVIAKAKEIMARAKKGEDFASLAKQFSQEPGAAVSGGDIGWFGKGRMVKPFEDAAMKGKPGEIIGPVKTQFGIHVIKVEGRDSRELKVADIHISIKASSQTKDAASQNAQDFVYIAKSGQFEKEAESLKLEIHETPEFQKGGFIPGLGFNESVSKFAFKNELNTISDAYPVTGGYAVIKVSEVKKEGVRPYDEVKENLKPRVLRKLKLAVLKELVAKQRAAMSDNASLLGVRGTDGKIEADTTGEFAANGGIPMIGRDNAFIGASLALPVGKVSQPIEGLRGCYLIKVIGRTPFDSAAFTVQRPLLTQQMLQEKKQRMMMEWMEKLKEKADIVDNREMFFR
ncbi:MAG: peptidylprolyl isomerase [Ignavibacteriales bacterium]|nr:peptidylprolyl isomerase [Ignavibacteriales bacterium]